MDVSSSENASVNVEAAASERGALEAAERLSFVLKYLLPSNSSEVLLSGVSTQQRPSQHPAQQQPGYADPYASSAAHRPPASSHTSYSEPIDAGRNSATSSVPAIHSHPDASYAHTRYGNSGASPTTIAGAHDGVGSRDSLSSDHIVSKTEDPSAAKLQPPLTPGSLKGSMNLHKQDLTEDAAADATVPSTAKAVFDKSRVRSLFSRSFLSRM
jgi:hypothetical protein